MMDVFADVFRFLLAVWLWAGLVLFVGLAVFDWLRSRPSRRPTR